MSTWYETLTSTPVLIASAVGATAAAVFLSQPAKTPAPVQVQSVNKEAGTSSAKGSIAQSASVMSAPNANLAPPKDDPITTSQLAKHDGSDPAYPIYVAIKGKVFDVSPRGEMYGPGKGYNVFAGKDGSRGLGMSSLDPADAIPEYSSLSETQMQTLNQWESFFEKRYNIVGKVVPE